MRGAFQFSESGSRVLREWNEQRQLKRDLIQRQRRVQLAGRNFAGAAVDRLTASMQQWSGSVNSDLDSGLVILRARARALCANNELGRRFLSLVAQNIVGPAGPVLQVRATNLDGSLDKAANDAIETHWARWAKTADIGGRMTLTRMLQVLSKGVARDGEGVVRLVRRSDLPYGLALQLLEPDRLDESINHRLTNGTWIRQGVELDTYGRPVAYYLTADHPGESYAGKPKTTERVLAKDIYHVYLPERAEQVRGYTWLHAVLIRAQMLHGYEEAAIVAARVGASKMGVWQRDPEASPDALKTIATGQDASGNLQISAEPGEFIEAPNGYTLESWNPDYPHQNFESFLKACMRGLASGVDVATHNLSGDMTEVNYSSARIAELSERDTWKLLQEWFISALLQPLFKAWLESALLRGQITFEQSGKSLPVERLDKFVDVARFQARRWEWVDPMKEVQAAREAIAERLVSRTSIAASQGREFEDVIDELKQEQTLMQKAGLAIQVPAAKPTAPADDSEDPIKEPTA